MFLNPVAFNALLNHLGQDVAWRRSISCPCRNPASGAAIPQCPTCDGAGQVWDTAVSGYVGLTGQQIQRQWTVSGQYEAGDVVVSLPSDSPVYAMGEYDRLQFTNSSEPFSVVRVKGKEKAFPWTVVSIDRADKLLNGALVSMPVPTVDNAGNLVWPIGSVPATGLQYTLSGRRRPEYFCFQQFPQDRAHHHGLALPRKVVLRKFDLFGRR